MTQKTSFFIAGRHAVIGALKNPNRRVLKIFLTEESKKNIHTVSYTHLTLPTNREV